MTIQPAWLTHDVVSLAQTIYDDRAFQRMPTLGDAIEEAGCTNTYILDHCQSQTGHLRGCSGGEDALLGRLETNIRCAMRVKWKR